MPGQSQTGGHGGYDGGGMSTYGYGHGPNQGMMEGQYYGGGGYDWYTADGTAIPGGRQHRRSRKRRMGAKRELHVRRV